MGGRKGCLGQIGIPTKEGIGGKWEIHNDRVIPFQRFQGLTIGDHGKLISVLTEGENTI